MSLNHPCKWLLLGLLWPVCSPAVAQSELFELIRTINRKYQEPDFGLVPADDPTTDDGRGIADGEELILEVRIDDLVIGDLFAIKHKDSALIAFGQFVDLLDFAIELDNETSAAAGWYINEDQSFSLNLPEKDGEQTAADSQAKAEANGVTYHLPASHFQILPDDLYIHADDLDRWFNIKMTFDFGAMMLVLKPEQPLPIQAALTRKQRQKSRTKTTSTKPALPLRKSGHELLSAPLLDISTNATYSGKDVNFGYSALGRHDLGFFSSQYYLGGGSENELDYARLTLEKTSLEGGLLGPVNATQYRFGDVVPVAGASGQERGMNFSNRPLTGNTELDTLDLQGDIQPGWDVELYRNDVLINALTAGPDGRYVFNDIELLYGNNTLRLIFYGPQGQIREKTKQVLVDSRTVEKQHYFDLSLTQPGSLFLNEPAANTADWHLAGKYSKSLSDKLLLDATFSKVERHNAAYSLDASFSLFDRLLMQAGVDNNGAYRMGGKTFLGKHALNFSHNADDGQFNDNVTLAGSLFQGRQTALNYEQGFSRRYGDIDQPSFSLQNRLSLYRPSFYLSNSFTYQRTEPEVGEAEDWQSGSALLRKRFSAFTWELGADYSLSPEAELTQLDTEFSRALSSSLNSEFGINYWPQTERYKADMRLNWKADTFYLSSTLSYDDRGEWFLGLNTLLSLGWDPQESDLYIDRRRLAQNGAISVRVFQDLNLNGRYDQDEPPVVGAKVKGTQVYRRASTNDKGIAFLRGLPAYRTTDIELEIGSLEDPYWMPSRPGISITPRPGLVETLDIPVVTTGEIEGMVYLEDGHGGEKPVAYAPLVLLDEQDQVVQRGESEYDGFYLFMNVLPGKFRVEIDKQYIEDKKLYPLAAVDVTINGDGDVLRGNNFSLAALSFQPAFLVSLGEFSSETTMKAYWHLLYRSHANILPQASYSKVAREGSEHLRLQLGTYYLNRAQAQSQCTRLQEQGINCRVTTTELLLEKSS
ncbi:MSCRAMM family protein [Vibrio natriegens]|uniref:MSCRAMM family protein n=1 Tax=Vibrio natriegens TaxID=691 RepID=UPI003B59E0D4